MNRLVLVLLLTILLTPFAAEAAWWNPLDWFGAHSQATVSTETTVDTTNDIDALKKENAELRAQVTNLLAITKTCKLTPTQTAVTKSAATVITPAPVPVPVQTTNNASEDSAKAKTLRVELARLDKLDLDVNTLYGNGDREGILNLMNNEKKLNGSSVFPKTGYATKLWYLWEVPTTSTWMHQLIASYRAELKIDLAQYPASEAPATY